MELSKEESDALLQISEGFNDSPTLEKFILFDKSKLVNVLMSLKKKGLIILHEKYDSHYKEKYYDIDLTDKGKNEVENVKK